ncbi:uncharacterized protein LOC111253835 isoform X2 [Varroa destructor]|uniref:Actin n=1 Tax=Varroa destructor TaxID=109461 RepID=A0A7M7KP82_VARDE|nr:uncharacterized protein LOC111253835 isoform X2 [Varroa destructor]
MWQNTMLCQRFNAERIMTELVKTSTVEIPPVVQIGLFCIVTTKLWVPILTAGYFDALSLKLESVAPATLEYEKLSTALCASQLQLAKLCTRNMRCFTQQAVRAREDPASLVTTTSTSSDPTLTPSGGSGSCGTTYLKASTSPVFDYDDSLMHDFNAVERLTQDQVHNLLAASGFDNVDVQLRQMLGDSDSVTSDNGNHEALNLQQLELLCAASPESGAGPDEHDYDSVDDADHYDYYIGDPIKELEVIPEEDLEEQYYEEPQRRKIQPLRTSSIHHPHLPMRTPSPRLGSPRHVESDSNSESSETNSVNTVVTEIRQQFSRQQQQSLHNLDSGHNNPNLSSHTADQHQRLFEERAEKVRSAVEKLIRDHQPKISHSTNLLNLIKNFENIAKNNEKVLEKIRHRSAPPRRKIVSSTSYISQEAEHEQERSPAVTLLNPVTVSMLSQQSHLLDHSSPTLKPFNLTSPRKSAASFARESILEQSLEEVMKPLTVQRLELPSSDKLHESANKSPSEKSLKMKETRLTTRQGFSATLKDQLERVTLGRFGQCQMDNINRLEERLNGTLKSIVNGDDTVVGAQALVDNSNDPLDSLANSKIKSLSSTNLCGSEALIPLLKDMYTLQDIAERPSPPEMKGYAHIVLNSKFREKFLHLKDGRIHVFEGEFTQRPLQKVDLTGKCILQLLDDRSIGLDFSSSASPVSATVLQLSSTKERDEWYRHLMAHADISLNFVVPSSRPLSSHKRCLVLDLGSCSVRAGILMDQATLPQVYFPSFLAIDKTSKRAYFGEDALNENIRKNCRLIFPLASVDKVTKLTMDTTYLTHLVNKVLKDLRLSQAELTEYNVQVILPQTYSLSTQAAIAKFFLEDLGVKGLNITHQAICALYAYNTTSGIVVDIGNRLDILPIADGYVVDSGVSRLLNGDQKIIQNLAHELAQKRVSLFNPLDVYMLRHIFQELCYVAPDYVSELQQFNSNPTSFSKAVQLSGLTLLTGADPVIELDQARFSVAEGLFQPQMWGLDCPGLSKLIAKAIMQNSIDMRKQMARSIYLSGGLTLLSGLRERIIADVSRLVPSALKVEVHASPYRLHMAYIGACTMASTGAFDRQCITYSQWRSGPDDCYKSWHVS